MKEEKKLRISLNKLREKGIELQLSPGMYQLWIVTEAIIEARRGKKWK